MERSRPAQNLDFSDRVHQKSIEIRAKHCFFDECVNNSIPNYLTTDLADHDEVNQRHVTKTCQATEIPDMSLYLVIFHKLWMIRLISADEQHCIRY